MEAVSKKGRELRGTDNSAVTAEVGGVEVEECIMWIIGNGKNTIKNY